jgi:anti-anti-sigma factor
MASQPLPRLIASESLGDVAGSLRSGGTAILEGVDEQRHADRQSRLIEGKTKDEYLLDFEGIDFVNSDYLVALVRLRRSLEAVGKQLTLCNVSAPVAEVFSVTGLGRFFHIRQN